MKERKSIPAKYKINTNDLFSSEEDFSQELASLEKVLPKITEYKGKLATNPEILYQALKLDTEIDKRLERLYVYANLNHDFDLSAKTPNELVGHIMNTYERYSALSAYMVPELLKTPYTTIESYIKDNNNLKEYALTLKSIYRYQNNTLSEPEEVILRNLSDALRLPEEAHSKLLDADLKFGTIKNENDKLVEITSSNFATYLESKNRDVRANTFKVFYAGFKSVINTTSELLASEVKNNNTIATLRHFPSALESSLYSNEVSPQVFETLLKSINDNLDIIHREWPMRAKILGLKDLHLYDTYVPLVKNYDKTYTFDEGKELVLKSLSILGEDYSKVLKEAFDESWIDVYPTKNKRSGGYCTAAYLTHPYVFLNFDGRYDEVSTIAHELGHAMHYYYAIKNNSYQNYSYSIFVAEVASQVNELLLSYYMYDNASNKEEKLFILDELIKRFKASVVRQSMFAEFERDIHAYAQNGNIITKEYLNDTYYKLNEKYYGPFINIDEEIKYEWSRIPHFYYNFYVYQYSTGYISALKIAHDIYNHVEGSLENYLKFLSLGSTMDPVNSLKVAGVDLTNEKIFTDAFKIFDQDMTKFSALTEKE